VARRLSRMKANILGRPEFPIMMSLYQQAFAGVRPTNRRPR
jgi:hypothetical protein